MLLLSSQEHVDEWNVPEPSTDGKQEGPAHLCGAGPTCPPTGSLSTLILQGPEEEECSSQSGRLGSQMSKGVHAKGGSKEPTQVLQSKPLRSSFQKPLHVSCAFCNQKAVCDLS